MALKINFKSTITMLRGNHECRSLTSFFNFKQECEVKYDLEVYDRFMEAFDSLPIACIINDKFISIHGGISPSLHMVPEINKINRINKYNKAQEESANSINKSIKEANEARVAYEEAKANEEAKVAELQRLIKIYEDYIKAHQ